MEKTIEEALHQIDEVLNYFRTSFERGGLTVDNIVNHFDPDHENNFGHNLIAILEKLERDKFIFIHSEDITSKITFHSYHISLEGKIFKGYVQQRKDEVLDKRIKENYDRRMERNASSLKIGTWV